MDRVTEFVKSIDHDYRGTCPNCGKYGTFTITHTIDGTMYNCYSNSCGTKGVVKRRITIDEFKQVLQREQSISGREVLPTSLIPLTSVPEAIQYINTNGCTYAYTHGLDIKYDMEQDRVVFTHNGVCVGRALKDIYPKWLRYDKQERPFLLHNNSTLVIVEDAASACAVWEVYSSMALLGTSVYNYHTNVLGNYDRIVIALDKDATIKATLLKKDLTLLHNYVIILPLERDLKHYNAKEIKSMVENNAR